MRPEVSVIVVNFRGEECLGPCLESLKCQLFKKFETILVDNGSEPTFVAEIAARFPWAILLQNPTNVGFAGAVNQAIGTSRGEFIATLNHDTIAAQGWLEGLVDTIRRHPQVGMCASQIRLHDRPDLLDSAGLAIHPDGLGKQRGRGEPADHYMASEEVFCPSACAALYRRTMLEEIGLLDEEFFAYCEDTDLGFRGRVREWGCAYVPQAVVHHRYSIVLGPYSLTKLYLVERNRLWTVFKNFPRPYLAASIPFTLVRYAAHALVTAAQLTVQVPAIVRWPGLPDQSVSHASYR